MERTYFGNSTPDGKSGKLVNPLSSETDLTDSGGGQPLLEGDPFKRSSLVTQSPRKIHKETGQKNRTKLSFGSKYFEST